MLRKWWLKFKAWWHKFTTRNVVDQRTTVIDFVKEREEEYSAFKDQLAEDKKRTQELLDKDEEIKSLLRQHEDNHYQLKELAIYVKSLKSRLQNPDFITTKKFSPQWRADPITSAYYYTLPNHRVIAEYKNGKVKFNPQGVKKCK
jgi:hypothetical protein